MSMLLWLVKVVCQCRWRQSAIGVLDLSGAAILLLWGSVELQQGCSGHHWGCSWVALDPSGTAVGLVWDSKFICFRFLDYYVMKSCFAGGAVCDAYIAVCICL